MTSIYERALTEPPITPLRTLRATLQSLRDEDIPLRRMSCLDCTSWRTCEFAFDPYNTDGDCLAEK